MSNQIQAAFDSVHAGQELKENTKKYLVHRSARRHTAPLRYAAAALLLLFVLAGGGYAFYMTPVAAISIDINPSMEWEVNRLDRIVSVICYNTAAENAADTLHLKHRKYDDALRELFESREMSEYLLEDSAVSFSVASEDTDRSMRMQERAAECAGHYCENVSCHGGSTQERREANEAGVSLGKYQAFRILREADPEITLEEVSRMHMCQIRSRMEACSAGEEGAAGDVESESGEEGAAGDLAGHGSGQHRHRHHHEHD